MRILVKVFLLVIACACCSSARTEESSDDGKTLYVANCSGCHGVDGKGMGALSSKLHSNPPDLTSLAKKNKGSFPVSEVYRIIDGREVANGHRVSDMPVWGCRYLPPGEASPPPAPTHRSGRRTRRSSARKLNSYEEHLNLGCDSEDVIANRILSIIEFLRHIQQR
jgi:hypothetical protein